MNWTVGVLEVFGVAVGEEYTFPTGTILNPLGVFLTHEEDVPDEVTDDVTSISLENLPAWVLMECVYWIALVSCRMLFSMEKAGLLLQKMKTPFLTSWGETALFFQTLVRVLVDFQMVKTAMMFSTPLTLKQIWSQRLGEQHIRMNQLIKIRASIQEKDKGCSKSASPNPTDPTSKCNSIPFKAIFCRNAFDWFKKAFVKPYSCSGGGGSSGDSGPPIGPSIVLSEQSRLRAERSLLGTIFTSLSETMSVLHCWEDRLRLHRPKLENDGCFQFWEQEWYTSPTR